MAAKDPPLEDFWADIRPSPKPVGPAKKAREPEPKKQDNAKKARCEICRTTENVTYASDPYASEIHDDHRPRHLCKGCRAARAEEI